MGSLNSHKPKPGKANTILKHRHLRKIAKLLRYIEFCVVLVLISRLSIQLPLAVKNSSEYFRGFSGFMVSPRFVFLIGNVIIITLFAQSGQFSAQGPARDNPEPDLYQEFLQNSIINCKNQKLHADKTEHPQKQSIVRTEDIKQIQNIDGNPVKYPEKLSVRTDISVKGKRIDGCMIQYREKQSMKPSTKTEDQKIDGGKIMKTNNSVDVKDYRRCQSDVIRHVESEKPRHVLDRCESENNRGSIEPAAPEKVAKTSYPEDGMSNEQFRRTIEAFIARQQRLRRQEQCLTA